MNCDTAEECLLDYLEGQLDAAQADAMRSHVDTCPTCRRALRETRELIDAIEHARRRQEQAWKQASRSVSASVSSSSARGKSFSFEPGRLLGDFEIINEIGRGGMGVVYRARQVTLNRVVALKVLPANVCQTESAISRFVREAQAAAKLHHTNIVPVYAQGEADGHFYYAMELIEGPNLGRLMKDDRSAILSGLDAVALSGTGSSTELSGISRMEGSGPRRRADYRRIADLIASVADALEHAHRLNVIHRDIKPQNLLLGMDGEFHITDFGLARLLDEPNMTVTGEMLGTPAYMSPEQVDADRERIDARTDIYSLGVTLYELLTGKRPFDGTSREQVIARVRDREPVAPRKHDPNIPIDLDTICLRAMEKSPHRRYQTAEALAADLRRFAEDKPIHARRVSVFEKGVKWVRRHPAKFTIGVLLVVMVGGGIAWYAQVRAEITRNANRRIEEAFNDLAYENYRDGDRAREKIAEAAPEFSDQALYWKTFGLSRVIENPKEAEKDLRKALELRPDDVECMYLLAWTLRRLEQPDKCEALIREADKALDSDSATWAQTPTVHFFRATAIVRSQPEKAEESYEKAIATYSLMSKGGAYYQARLHLGRAKNNAQYHTRSAEDFTAIEKNLSMACTLHPEQAYPHYLLSLAYRINAEIYLAQGDVDRARRRFATALAHAENAVDAEPRSPRGYAARAEFWESVSDRCDELGRLKDDAERKAFHESHAQNEHSDGTGACEFCDWLGTPQDEALRRAVAERSIALPGLNDKDELEFYEYRWLDHYWLGDLVAAGDDLGKVAELTPETHQKWIWYTRLAPLLIDAERQGVDVAGEALNSLTNALAESKDFRVCTSIACLHHLFGRADLASAFLADRRGAVEFGEGDMAAWEILANTEGAPGGDREVPRNARACSLFFRGVVALGAGDREAAGAWLVACEECYDYEDYGYLARMLRRRMDSDPAWPNWAPQNTDVGN